MALPTITSRQIRDGEVKKIDINTTSTGEALTTRIIAGTAITLSSTGVDSGTGDVTINSQFASSTLPGILSVGAQSISGDKTFTDNILPDTTNTNNIGSNTLNYNSVYTRNVLNVGLVKSMDADQLNIESDDNLDFKTNSASKEIRFYSNTVLKLRFDDNDSLFPNTDDQFDLGKSTNRFNEAYLKTILDVQTLKLNAATNGSIVQSTSDGADNKSILMSGGGAFSSSRGAFIQLAGNEAGDLGHLNLGAGNVTGGRIKFATGGANVSEFNESGHFRPLANNTYDIGTSSANQYRNIYGQAIISNGTTINAPHTALHKYKLKSGVSPVAGELMVLNSSMELEICNIGRSKNAVGFYVDDDLDLNEQVTLTRWDTLTSQEVTETVYKYTGKASMDSIGNQHLNGTGVVLCHIASGGDSYIDGKLDGVKVTNENGNVWTGDYLTSSILKPGFLMKQVEPEIIRSTAAKSIFSITSFDVNGESHNNYVYIKTGN